MSHKPCRYYRTSEGCRFGSRCNFLHDAQTGPSSSIRGRNAQSNYKTGSNKPIWTPTFTSKPREPRDIQVDRWSTDELFDVDDRSLTPMEVDRYLQRFLSESYGFKTPPEIYAFVAVLNNATVKNTTWKLADGQLLLHKILEGAGQQRIAEIISWNNVSAGELSNKICMSFQRGYLPLLRYLSSEFITKSASQEKINALYAPLVENLSHFCQTVENCMDTMMDSRSFRDPHIPQKRINGIQVINILRIVVYQCVTRFKNLISTQPEIGLLAKKLQQWSEMYINGVSASPPTFEEISFHNPEGARHSFKYTQDLMKQLISIVERETRKHEKAYEKTTSSPKIVDVPHNDTRIFMTVYQGPGTTRSAGPRYDNDHIYIHDISIIPTREELLSSELPALPGNFFEAPHHLIESSMDRLLDIQFRLLREELVAPLRSSISEVIQDLRGLAADSGSKPTTLKKIFDEHGGKYRGKHGDESVLFNVYTDVNFLSLSTDRGISVKLRCSPPPGKARVPQSKNRKDFWKNQSGKRLMQGGLIALVWKQGSEIDVFIGKVMSSSDEIAQSSSDSRDHITIRISFFDHSPELRILSELRQLRNSNTEVKFLVETPILIDTIRPFLKALCAEPQDFPFDNYLVLHPPEYFGSQTFSIDPPRYARVPGFEFQLSSLFEEKNGPADLRLNVTCTHSIDNARTALKDSRLDPSQACAVVDALCREVALIQGPPGTGKSFTGIELLRVLLANQVKPILLIAYTNHALDHLLSSILDAGITTKIARLGSSSSNERISAFSLENLKREVGYDQFDRVVISQAFKNLKFEQQCLQELLDNTFTNHESPDEVTQFLEIQYPSHYQGLIMAPSWILLHKSLYDEENQDEQWQRADSVRTGSGSKTPVIDTSIYHYWLSGTDLDFLQFYCNPPGSPSRSEDPRHSIRTTNNFSLLDNDFESTSESSFSSDDDDDNHPILTNSSSLTEQLLADDGIINIADKAQLLPQAKEDPTFTVLRYLGLNKNALPRIPTGERLHELLRLDADIWGMSSLERKRLHQAWCQELKEIHSQTFADDFIRFRDAHTLATERLSEAKKEKDRHILQGMDIIGCTTTGAAKFSPVLKELSPRVLMVEEAGQVLEAHILGTLVPSIEHLIMIGDPKQLRPSLNNYKLSVDSKQGSTVYKFDKSLMERLSDNGFPMSCINVQRRMRPSISSLIRNTLYSELEDHELVKNYPHVRGFGQDVFFLTHTNEENENNKESTSKYNLYEVEMIKDLVLYLLRQGCYSEEGDIVVLCAYLGQLAKLRDALSNQVAVVIDDRDLVALADQDDKGETSDVGNEVVMVEKVKVSKRVRLRTVDNYQGEEARIVILSLVRNSGSDDEDRRGSIGFLKSRNRTNVALSRAKEGLIILGNHVNLSGRSEMWRDIIQELDNVGCVGKAIPLTCSRHPDYITYVSKPGDIPRFAPNGGCLRICGTKLRCGHVCAFKCHPDDPLHLSVECPAECPKLCSRGHPCVKRCAEPCGSCKFMLNNVTLPCGHISNEVPCYLLDDLTNVICHELLQKKLPFCEHSALVPCSTPPEEYQCRSLCDQSLGCCSRNCKSLCHECMKLNILQKDDEDDGSVKEEKNFVKRVKHKRHVCQRSLYCGHLCDEVCSEEHQCSEFCKKPCRQECPHSRCTQPCSAQCAPCQEPCTWNCSHHTCPVPCGSICARLPCDMRCDTVLDCGHRCPSVCSEDCSIQVCPDCASADQKNTVVDLILQLTLGDIYVDQATLDNLLITLPKCRHVFTVETLDGHCSIQDFYLSRNEKWIGLTAPPSGFLNPPVCPTCRAAITSPRYGRIIKRANLDILERNVASGMSRALNQIQESVERLQQSQKASVEALQISAGGIRTTSTIRNPKRSKRQNALQNLLRKKRMTPIPEAALNVNNQKYYEITPSAIPNTWNSAVRPLIAEYLKVIRVLSTRSAHLYAWEASFSSLYRREMDSATLDPAHAPRDPHMHAMRMATMNVGQPKPQAESRYQVEGFWISLRIRFLIIELAVAFLSSPASADRIHFPMEQVRNWITYVMFMLDSCRADAELAYNIAESSQSRRQMTSSAGWIMLADLEKFQFLILIARLTGKALEKRLELAEECKSQKQIAQEYSDRILREHLSAKANEEISWLEDNFIKISNTVIRELTSLKDKLLHPDVFYQPMSSEEKMGIVKAMNFTHTGHFYRCPNGHTYVIADCGGAVEQAICPECGARIGGSGHNLLSNNSRAEDFSELERQNRQEQSPWPWAQ